MPFVAMIDQMGRPAWIVLMILAFWCFWPLGLAVLAFGIGSGRMGCGHYSSEHWQRKMERLQTKMDEVRSRMGGGNSGGGNPWGRNPWRNPPTSGNRAFDDYRAETLRRLEDEQREFHDFLDRLRMAKDKSEFDQFMAERRNRPNPTPDSDPQPQH